MDERIVKYQEKMDKTLANLDSEFGTIRAGRANPHVLDRLRVDYYGTPTPIQQVGNVTIPEARMIQIAPWEKSLIKEIEKAIMTSDIGINPSLAKYHSSAGQYQQIEGPPLARRMLARYDIANDIVERVCYLVAHHHTYTQMDGLDYRILVESDFLVNLYEDQSSVHAIQTALSRYFTTETGRWLLQTMFLAAPLV